MGGLAPRFVVISFLLVKDGLDELTGHVKQLGLPDHVSELFVRQNEVGYEFLPGFRI
jgi:hypothetical protein